jgi:hypothetical protein
MTQKRRKKDSPKFDQNQKKRKEKACAGAFPVGAVGGCVQSFAHR